MIRATAPGKMILLGEYAVLEGAPALVCAVNRRASVRIYPEKGSEFSVHSPSLQTGVQPFILTPDRKVRFDPNLNPIISNKLHFFSDIFESVIESLNGERALPFIRIELETNAFYSLELHRKLGFGSSSALTTALTKALAEVSETALTDSEIFSLALKAHRAAQGKRGSGIDIAACTYGGVLEYTLETVPKTISPWAELPLAVVWSGTSASTSKMVQRVSVLKQQNPALYKKLIERLTLVSQEGITAYREQRTDLFLSSVHGFYTALKELGEKSNTSIISGLHQQLAEMAAQNGVVYKPSGAGGGDIGLLFASSYQALKTVKNKAIHLGFKIVDTVISSDGVTVQN